MNYKYLLCLFACCFFSFSTYAQSAPTLLANLDNCPDKLLPYPNAPEDQYREGLVKDVLKMNMNQFNNFQANDIEVYLRSLVIKSKDYHIDSSLLNFDNFNVEEGFCKLYKWYLVTEQRYERNKETVYNLERDLYLKPMYKHKGDWSIRVWHYDTQNNFYNIFDLIQKDNKTLNGDYLKISRDEKGVLLDSFNLNIASTGLDAELSQKVKALNFQYETDQSRLPFLVHPEGVGNVTVIQFRKKDERHFFYYYDLAEYAKKERHTLTHRNAMKLLDLIEEYYGIKMTEIGSRGNS